MGKKVFLKREQIIQIEKEAVESGLTYSRLMENAGSAAARIIRETWDVKDKKIMILSGKGNNSGDGFVVARKLFDEGARVTILLLSGYPTTKESTEKYEQAKQFDIDIINFETDPFKAIPQIRESDIIVDSVFGIGFHGNIPEHIVPVFKEINNLGANVVALDIPSGMNADSGEFDKNTLRAKKTITFISMKQAFATEEAKEVYGEIVVAKIGIDEEIVFKYSQKGIPLTSNMIRANFRKRNPESHKGDYGNLLTICGSVGMAGAAAMSIKAALRSGSGKVTAAVISKVYDIVAPNIWEAVFHLVEDKDGKISDESVSDLLNQSENATATIIGPGLGVNSNTEKLVKEFVLNSKKPMVIDADAINCISLNPDDFIDSNNDNEEEDEVFPFPKYLSILKSVQAPLILTPHPKEMSRLTGLQVEDIEKNRVEIAQAFAEIYNVTLVLKGHNTVVASPNNPALINKTGSPGMATGGSGDVLTGIIGSFLAQGFKPRNAASCGVFLHGLSGEKAAEKMSQHGMLPTDILKELCNLFLILEEEE